MKKLFKHRILWFALLFMFLLVVAILVFLNISTDTTFSVAVTTERLELEIHDDRSSRIPLADYQMYNFNGDSLGIAKGSFEIEAGSKIIVERVSTGFLTIQVQGRDIQPAGRFYSEANDQFVGLADNFVEFVVPDPGLRSNQGENILIPFAGEVVLGRAINSESQLGSTALVREGKITMIGKSTVGNQFFESGTYNLNIGDQFIVDNPKSKAYGFISVNENPGMQVAFRVVGKKARIIPPGPMEDHSGYNISTSLVSRFMSDSLFQAMSLAAAIIIVLSTFMTFIKDVGTCLGFKAETSKKGKKGKKK